MARDKRFQFQSRERNDGNFSQTVSVFLFASILNQVTKLVQNPRTSFVQFVMSASLFMVGTEKHVMLDRCITSEVNSCCL